MLKIFVVGVVCIFLAFLVYVLFFKKTELEVELNENLRMECAEGFSSYSRLLEEVPAWKDKSAYITIRDDPLYGDVSYADILRFRIQIYKSCFLHAAILLLYYLHRRWNAFAEMIDMVGAFHQVYPGNFLNSKLRSKNLKAANKGASSFLRAICVPKTHLLECSPGTFDKTYLHDKGPGLVCGFTIEEDFRGGEKIAHIGEMEDLTDTDKKVIFKKLVKWLIEIVMIRWVLMHLLSKERMKQIRIWCTLHRNTHAMVLLGIRDDPNDKQQHFLLQNSWRSKMFVDVSLSYMSSVGAKIYFATKDQKEISAKFHPVKSVCSEMEVDLDLDDWEVCDDN